MQVRATCFCAHIMPGQCLSAQRAAMFKLCDLGSPIDSYWCRCHITMHKLAEAAAAPFQVLTHQLQSQHQGSQIAAVHQIPVQQVEQHAQFSAQTTARPADRAAYQGQCGALDRQTALNGHAHDQTTMLCLLGMRCACFVLVSAAAIAAVIAAIAAAVAVVTKTAAISFL